MFYDFVTTPIQYALRMFGGIGCIFDWNRANIGKIPLRFTRIHLEIRTKLGMNYESVKNTPKACTSSARIKGNPWLFLIIREIFSLKLGIKSHLPLLGHYFKNKCSS